MVGGSAEAMVGLVYYFIGINSYVRWCIHSLVVVFDDKATYTRYGNFGQINVDTSGKIL